MDTNALNRLVKYNGKDGVFVCANCGSLQVQVKAWVGANYHEFKGFTTENLNLCDCWCESEEAHSHLMPIGEFEDKMREHMKTLPETCYNPEKWEKLSYFKKREQFLKFFKAEVWNKEFLHK